MLKEPVKVEKLVAFKRSNTAVEPSTPTSAAGFGAVVDVLVDQTTGENYPIPHTISVDYQNMISLTHKGVKWEARSKPAVL